MKKIVVFSFLIVAVLAIDIQAQVLRGPYLNSGSETGMVLRWRTANSEVGLVKYGSSPTTLTQTATETSAKTNHEITLNGLQPNTTYFYAIGNDTSVYTTADSSYYFRTSPVADSRQKQRVWVIGDFGNGTQAQIDVKDAYVNNFSDMHTDLWLWMGDNAYNDGTDAEFQSYVFDIYPNELKNMVVWPCPGNHDYGSIDLFGNGPYYDIFTLPKNAEAGGVRSGTEFYYSFDYGNVHYISINSEYLPAIALANTSFTQWLKQDLAATNKDWIIAFWHQPPYSKGTHNSDETFSRMELTRQNVVPILEDYGVDLVLNGHSHGYERSYLLKGHFGKSDTFNPSSMILDGSNGNPNENNEYVKYTNGPEAGKGTVYCVVGSSGQKGDGTNPLNHPAMYISTEDYHGSLVMDIEGLTLHAKFIDKTGFVIDEFSIMKEPGSLAGIDNNEKHHNGLFLNAYPNPFRETFTIEFVLEKSEEVVIEIKDIDGRTIEMLGKKKYDAGKHVLYHTPTNKVKQGVYLIEIKTKNNQSAKRLVRMQ